MYTGEYLLLVTSYILHPNGFVTYISNLLPLGKATILMTDEIFVVSEKALGIKFNWVHLH